MKQKHDKLTRRSLLKGIAAGIAAAAAAPMLEAVGKATSPFAKSAASDSTAPEGSTVRIARLQPVNCTECDRCMPCGYGVDIPGNFKIYNAMLAKGEVPDIDSAASDPAFDSKAKHFLRAYDRAIPDRHQSQRCIRCYHCTSECDQHIFIVSELAELTRITDFLRNRNCTI